MRFLQVIYDNGWQELNSVLITKFLIDLVAVFVLVKFIYLRKHKRTDLFLTFFSFNVIVFFISYLLNRVDMSTGAAFGLFAIFSILRYRTEGISANDMTYLFLCIALGLMMAVSTGTFSEHLILAAALLLLTFILESGLLARRRATMKIIFERPDMIIPDRRAELLQELERRTGLRIHHVEIGDIDYLKDAVTIHIHYDL